MKKASWEDRGFKNLLVWLFLYLVVGPFLESLPYAIVVINIILSAVLFSAAYSVFGHKGVRALSMVFLGAGVILLWLETLGLLQLPWNLVALVLLLYFSLLVYSFSKSLLAVTRVTTNVVCAALGLYLILGLWWGAVYTMLESLCPGSFSGHLIAQTASPQEKAHFLNYFSFVTLTTLGYGDITPQTRGATGLCQAEAMIGQFFIAVLVARLVSVQVAQEQS